MEANRKGKKHLSFKIFEVKGSLLVIRILRRILRRKIMASRDLNLRNIVFMILIICLTHKEIVVSFAFPMCSF